MKQIQLICIVALLCLSTLAMSQTNTQTKTFSGVVQDENGQPVIGASVTLPGGKKGTITDSNGKFSINASINDVLTFRFIGYLTQTEVLKTNKSLVITLKENTQNLDEVVVVGYGTMKRKDLIGSVTSITGNELKDIPVTSAISALTGRLAGVSITTSEGGPDAKTSILVRGAGSITGDNSPLYIVDGMSVSSISDISTADIASIDVLKDASSTAIYGARGANGVVIVTTKSGIIGKPKVSYSGVFGVEQVKKFYDVMNPYEYVLAQAEIQLPATFTSLYGNYQDIDLYKDLKGNNWQKQLLGGIGNRTNHTLQITGGDNNIQYSASLNRVDTKDIMVNTKNDFTTLSAKTTYTVSKWLKLDLSTRFTDKNTLGAGTSSGTGSGLAGPSMANMIQFSPINTLKSYQSYDVSNEFSDAMFLTSFLINPVQQANDTYRNVSEISKYINASATLTLTPVWNYRFEYGSTSTDTRIDKFWGVHTGNAIQNGQLPLINQERSSVSSYRLANLLNFNKPNILPHQNLSAVLGQEYNYYGSNYMRIDARNFPVYMGATEAFANMSLAGTTYPVTSTIYVPVKTYSWFGRANYDYNKRYMLTATFRADGSSKFAPGNRWGFFPSVGLGWRISDENFLASTKSWLSDLKLRASYGVSGNDRIGTSAWLPNYSVSSGSLFLESNETSPTAYYALPSFLYNQNVKWETTVSQNVGLDFSILSGRFNGTIEVYNKIVKDLLLNAKIPTNTGFDSQYQNIGQTSNKGVEFTLNSTILKTNKLSINASFNIAFNVNNVDKLGETKSWYESSQWSYVAKPLSDYLIAEGQPLGQMYGLVVDGMYSFDDFTYSNGIYTLKPGIPNNSTVNSVSPIPGTIKYKDLNGDGLITDADKKVLGYAYPIHTGGFKLNVTYDGFDLSTFFNWSYGNSIYNANNMIFTSNPNQMPYRNYLNTMNSTNRFMTIDPNNTGAGIITDPVKLYELNKNATIWSVAKRVQPMLTSYDVEDGSFLRLSNITFGYTFSKKVLKFFKISNLRCYSTFSNVWIWTNYRGNDPEVSNSSNQLTPGVDWNAYPRTISANVGVNITL